MNKEEWVDQVGRGFARSMPDMFPEGYAYWLASERAEQGAYEAYKCGEFADGVLYEPRESWS